jgi:hypothetical protein
MSFQAQGSHSTQGITFSSTYISRLHLASGKEANASAIQAWSNVLSIVIAKQDQGKDGR